MEKEPCGIQRRYDRIAPRYDLWDSIPERLLYHTWRKQLFGRLTSGRILEIGIGTGKNIPFYPPGVQVTGVDISPEMLARAAGRADIRHDISISLAVMDVSALSFPDDTFDVVVGSFVLTVLPDLLGALQEIKRVCKPAGKLMFLEFTRSENRLVSLLQNLVTPLTYAVYKAHLNREITKLLEMSGFQMVTTEEVKAGMVKIIMAVVP